MLCGLRLKCEGSAVIAQTVIEGWSLCNACRDYVIERNVRYPDGRLVVLLDDIETESIVDSSRPYRDALRLSLDYVEGGPNKPDKGLMRSILREKLGIEEDNAHDNQS